MMRFFTRDWCDGKLSDEEYERAVTRYRERFEKVHDSLPNRLLELSETISLNDAWIKSAVLNGRVFTFELRVGDLQKGYADLKLSYNGVTALQGSPSVSQALNDDDVEVIADEVDVLDSGETEHRFLFGPEGELVIRFNSFDYSLTPVATRGFTRARPIFQTVHDVEVQVDH